MPYTISNLPFPPIPRAYPPLVMGLIYGALGDYTIGFLLLAATATTAAAFTATAMRRRAR